MRANDKLEFPAIGTDSATKGTFILEHATLLYDYDEEENELTNVRATGGVLIEGYDNPLFDAIKEHPLRVQGLTASVMFGVEKKFIKFLQISNYNLLDDGLVKEIDFSLTFEILDNLNYLEQMLEYKDNNNL